MTLIIEGIAGIEPAATDQARRAFRDALGHFATGVTVMTTVSDSKIDLGLTVSSFNSLSLDPPLILWSIANGSIYYDHFRVKAPFIVNVLSEAQESLAVKFSRPGSDKFENIGIQRGLDGVPLLEGCVVYLECLTEARYPGGDHDIVVGRVRRIFNVGKAPLLFHDGSLRSLGENRS